MQILARALIVTVGPLFAVAACDIPGTDGTPEPEGSLEVEIPFVGLVNGEPFACDQTFTNVGSGNASAQGADFRFYIHNVNVLDEDGAEHAVDLRDNDFQGQGHALIDFEDGTGACDTGSPERHTVVAGTLAESVVVKGVTFTLGVSPADNHLDVSTAQPPLNIPSMYWSWAGGYKFMAIDLIVGEDESPVRFHQGASNCTGTPDEGFSCLQDNQPRFSFDLDLDADAIGVDLGVLYDSVDLEAPLVDGDGVKGCMSFSGDPECPPMFGTLGIGFEDAAPVDADDAITLRVGDRDLADEQNE
jgi:uncharacterized repeat protein (TIGR04052 family)